MTLLPDANHVSPITLLLFFGSLIFTALFGSVTCGLWVNHLTMRGVVNQGIETVAILETKYVDEYARFWFQYRFTTLTDETYLSSIEVSQVQYNAHVEGVQLTMRYTASEPRYNALDLLQDDILRNIWQIFPLSALVLVISGVLAFGWMRTIRMARLRELWNLLGQ